MRPAESGRNLRRRTESAVRLFQTRRTLHSDGVVGPLTSADIFGEQPVVDAHPPAGLLAATVKVALTQEGVRETSGTPNRGPVVDQYIRSVGLDPAGGYSWCQAFVYWSFEGGAHASGVADPACEPPVLDHWARSPQANRIYAGAALDNPALVRPGSIFIVDHGGGRGRAGLVTHIASGEIGTIEGNTNERGSREGDGVYQKTRSIASINVGFIDYAAARG